MSARTICLFSCGAASAVATKLTLQSAPDALIYNTEIVEEHPDNKRFLADCEKWFGKQVTIWKNENFGGSIYAVFEKEKFLKNVGGAPCTKHLKRSMYKQMFNPGDTMIVGFTAEEEHRFNRLVHGIGGPDGVNIVAPLIERGITKGDTLSMLERAGITLPMMYRLGYSNNNCIGCVKAGKGYWNKIREDFPDVFERMAELEQRLGASLFAGKNGRTTLRDLRHGEGADIKEPDISCGIFCQIAEDEYSE